MAQSEIDFMVERHRKWLESAGEIGERANFKNMTLIDINFEKVKLQKADFSGSFLLRVNFSNADLSKSDFTGVTSRDSKFYKTILKNTKFIKANLCGEDFLDVTAGGSNFEEADLIGVSFRDSNFTSTRFVGANFDRTLFAGTSLNASNFSGAKNILSQIEFMNKNFETTKDGYIVYKCFDFIRKSPKTWIIEPNSIIEEVCNPNRTDSGGCGINVSTLEKALEIHNIGEKVYKLLIKWEWATGVVVPYSTDGNIRCEKAMILGEATF